VVDDALDQVLEGLFQHGQEPALAKPAFSAASASANQTSATVWSYH
jgi:hypothetical protein